ncbi:MAG: hypothetical protein ACXAEF_07605 [Candidatus Thorarchaeota archaeon]|jgi:hypothetical protein
MSEPFTDKLKDWLIILILIFVFLHLLFLFLDGFGLIDFIPGRGDDSGVGYILDLFRSK